MPGTFAMADYTNSAEEIIDGTRWIDKEINNARKIIEADLPLVRIKPVDYLYQVACIIPQNSEHDKLVKQMGRDLYDGTPEEKQPWLDKVCDLCDNFDVSNIDLSDTYAVHDALTVCALKKSMTNLERENRGYFAERYADPLKRVQIDGLNATQLEFASLVDSVIAVEQDPTMMHFGGMGNPLGVDAAQKNLENSVLNYRIQTLGDTFNEIPFVVPKEFNQCISMNIDKMEAPNPEDYIGLQHSKWAFNNLFCEPKGYALVSDKDRLQRDDLILIDGKSVSQIIDDKNMVLDPRQREIMSNNIIATALTSGKNRVDAVYLHAQDDGSFKTIVQAVKPDLTALGDTTKQDYSWFHRHLYNYGSHKCLTRAEKADALYAKPISEKVEEKMKASLEKLDERIGVYGVYNRNNIEHDRMDAKRRVTSAKELQDEIAPVSSGTKEQRLMSQQATKRQPDRTLNRIQ